MYRTLKVIVKNGELFSYLSDVCEKSKNMYNVTNFYIRQCMTGCKKDADKLTSNEAETLEIVREGLTRFNAIKKENAEKKGKEYKESQFPTAKKWFLGYNELDAIFKTMDNVDYRALPVHVAQLVIKRCCKNWKSYFKANKKYKKHPEGFTGKPNIVGYKKGDETNALFSNQVCTVWKNENGRFYVKFPKTKCKLWLGKCIDPEWKFVQLEAVPLHGVYEAVLTFDDLTDTPEVSEKSERIAAIDIGVNNLAAISNNIGMEPLLVKGRVLKSANQWANKQIAHYRSILTKGTKPEEHIPDSKRIDTIWRKRDGFIDTYLHTVAKRIVSWLADNQIDTLVVGHNNQWKSGCDIGKQSTQNFVCIPFNRFISILEYLCEREGIRLIKREESYTSKASFLHEDTIPVYGKDDKDPSFSGTRNNRLYKAGKHLINSDVNGSYNILRKEFPDAFKDIWEQTRQSIFHPKVLAI